MKVFVSSWVARLLGAGLSSCSGLRFRLKGFKGFVSWDPETWNQPFFELDYGCGVYGFTTIKEL